MEFENKSGLITLIILIMASAVTLISQSIVTTSLPYYTLTHETVVDVNAGELLADGLDEQRSHNGRINAAGQRQQHLLIAYLSADLGYLLMDKSIGQRFGSNAFHGFGTDVLRHI